jgi:hypothetical protein
LQRQGAAESGHPQAAKASSDRPGASTADSALPCPRPRPIDHITRWCIPHTSMKTAKLPCHKGRPEFESLASIHAFHLKYPGPANLPRPRGRFRAKAFTSAFPARLEKKCRRLITLAFFWRICCA